MRSRVVAASVAVALAVLLAACTPTPEPTPSPTGFASEEEAFEAAEETYRAYVDALNERRIAPDPTPDPKAFLTGEALQADIDAQRRLQAQGIRVEGRSSIASIMRESASENAVALSVCMDASATKVINAAGEDVTPTDRQLISALEIGFVGVPGDLYISSTEIGSREC